ncbi:MAG: hypothetical protein HPY62_07220 [Bacteroidales bacterium]|nr:hypothetical protein [Bacteroidales bacterium]
MKKLISFYFIIIACASCSTNKTTRHELSLNGTWEIVRTGIESGLPAEYNSKITVPGLVDMALPPVQLQDTIYENSVYWHRRTFRIDNASSDVVILKINKSRYYTRVYINGKKAGENAYCFTPLYFDIKPYLNKSGEDNEIVIAVGCKNYLPDTVANGWDFEKIKYIPGIYDDVKIICAGYPYIENIQVAPDLEDEKLRVVAELKTGRSHAGLKVKYVVKESVSGKIVNEGVVRGIMQEDRNAISDFSIPMKNCRLWSPEDPFLYELTMSTSGDSKTTRFGMRSFRASSDSGIFLLNGKPYYMRGTNVCIFRFFEDPTRGRLPWDNEWVIKLHNRFKEMYWNSARYCIGFPPERWYEIADSLGFLIQDEFPLWTLGKENFAKYLGRITPEQLAAEYRQWMGERWNHPCVVVWDAQNESITEVTGKAIQLVRHLDLSGRPWDNGWAPPVSPTDAIESHPYLFSRYQQQKPSREGYLKELLSEIRIPGNDPNSHYPLPEGRRYNNPLILNEYGWIWLNRDGSTTTLTDKVYENVWPWAKTPEQRFEIYAKSLGILTEYWRSHRKAAAVMHFCGLGYSRPQNPRGQTSDHFVDLQNLVFEPNFYRYVRPAFSPVGLMAEFWEESVTGGTVYLLPVHIINDTYSDYVDTLKVSLWAGKRQVSQKTIKVKVNSSGKSIYDIPVEVPREKEKYILEAEIVYNGQKIKSIREFQVR